MVSLILTPFALTMWLTQDFVDCNKFNKGEIDEVRIEWHLKECRNKRRTDKIRTKLTHQNKIKKNVDFF